MFSMEHDKEKNFNKAIQALKGLFSIFDKSPKCWISRLMNKWIKYKKMEKKFSVALSTNCGGLVFSLMIFYKKKMIIAVVSFIFLLFMMAFWHFMQCLSLGTLLNTKVRCRRS